jgi:hypothetical protein
MYDKWWWGWWGCGARAVDIIIVHRYDNVAFRQSLPHRG